MPFYNMTYSLLELLVDPQMFTLYIIKGLRLLFTYVALFLATRSFSQIYEKAVFDNTSKAPSFLQFLFLFVAFDFSFNVFLLAILFLLKYLFKTDSNTFIVDNYLFSKYIIDYVVSIAILLFIGYLISRIIIAKKYFRYKYEGLRAIRAYESLMFNIACVIYSFPYFMIF